MDVPENDPFIQAAREIEQVCSEKSIPKDVKKRLEKASERLRGFAKDIWDAGDDHEPHVDGEECHDCAEEQCPKVVQIMPALAGIQAVFAEPDTQDVTKMSVEPVIAFAVMDNNGFTFITGVCLHEDSCTECETVATFMGYIREGESPDKYAKKTREFLANQRKHEDPE